MDTHMIWMIVTWEVVMDMVGVVVATLVPLEAGAP
jgi:hypothetical protein